MKRLECVDPIEVPYYSAKIFPPVCFRCGGEVGGGELAGGYPTCASCTSGGRTAGHKRSYYPVVQLD